MINTDASLIKYIKNPSEEIQILAVKKNYRMINFIQKPTRKVKIFAKKEFIKKELSNYN